MTYRRLLFVLLIFLLPLPAAAQLPDVCTGPPDMTVCTGPITSAMRFEFFTPDNVTNLTAAQALEPRVYIDGSLTVFTALAEVCAGAVVPFRCVAPVPPTMLAQLNVAGLHAVTIRLFDPSTGTEGPSAIPFALRSPPAAPTGVRIIRQGP